MKTPVVNTADLKATIAIPADGRWFEGHFPGRPVVAGVVQIHWVMQAAREVFGPGLRPRAFENLKFRDLLLPEQVFRLSLELSDDGALLRFRLFSDSSEFSSGKVVLR